MVERTPLEMTRLTAGPRHLIRTWGPRHIAYLPSGEIVLTCMGATSGHPVPNLDGIGWVSGVYRTGACLCVTFTVARVCIDVYRVRIERERIGYTSLHVYRICIRRVSESASWQ